MSSRAGAEMSGGNDSADPKGVAMVDSPSETLERTAAVPDPPAEPTLPSPPIEPPLDEPPGRSAAFDAQVEQLRREYFTGTFGVVLPGLQKRIRRRLGLAPVGLGATLLAGFVGAGIRLGLALFVTALFGDWAGIPWGRWAIVLAAFFATEADNAWTLLPQAEFPKRYRQTIENWTALYPTIVREADVRDLADFTRRWLRLPVVVAAGVAVATVMLLAGILFTPGALGELPAGSIVLLAWVLVDFGMWPIYWGNVFNRAFTAREARFDHHLFWPSPADSPEVQKVMRKTTVQGFGAGLYTTGFLVLAVVLVGWESPLVVPLAVGFVVIGYLTTIGLAFGNRASVRKIIERSRQRRLALFRSRIDAFESRMADLTPEESEQLRNLLFLHDRIRDAPGSPANAHTVLRTAAGLLIPTIAFVITVFGEVSAERFLDALLP